MTTKNPQKNKMTMKIRVENRSGRPTGAYGLAYFDMVWHGLFWSDLACLVDRPRFRLFRKHV